MNHVLWGFQEGSFDDAEPPNWENADWFHIDLVGGKMPNAKLQEVDDIKKYTKYKGTFDVYGVNVDESNIGGVEWTTNELEGKGAKRFDKSKWSCATGLFDVVTGGDIRRPLLPSKKLPQKSEGNKGAGYLPNQLVEWFKSGKAHFVVY